jgi:hypothetical protein
MPADRVFRCHPNLLAAQTGALSGDGEGLAAKSDYWIWPCLSQTTLNFASRFVNPAID